MTPGQRYRPTLPATIVVAVAIRLGLLAALPSVFDFPASAAVHGSGAFDAYAANLLSSGTYGYTPGVPDAVLPPLYSVVLAGVYRMMWRGSLPVALLNTALDLIGIAAVASLGRRLFGSRMAGGLAALAVACYPYHVFQALSVSDSSLAMASTFGVLWLVVRARDTHGGLRAAALGAAAGVACGLALLGRPPALLVGLGAAAWLATIATPTKRAAAALLVATMAIPPVLWGLRNQQAIGAFVPFSTNGGSNLWSGNNADTVRFLRAGYDVQWIPEPPRSATDRLGPEGDAELRRRALDFLREHPVQIPVLAWTKFTTLWSIDVTPRRNPAPGVQVGTTVLDPDDPVSAYSRPLFDRAGRLVHRMYWGAWLVLGLAGLLVTWSRARDTSLLLVPIVATTVVYVVFHPSTRYRAPADPAVFLFAAGLVGLSVEARRRPPTPARLEGVRVAWFGTARFPRPLDGSQRRKWAAIGQTGIRPLLIGFRGGPPEDAEPAGEPADPVDVYRLPAWGPAPVRWCVFGCVGAFVLARACWRHDVRIVVAQGPYEAAVASLPLRLLRAAGRDVALVVESHGDFERWLFMQRRVPGARLVRVLMRLGVRAGLALADAGRAVSSATAAQLRQHAPGLSVEVFPAWIDRDAWSEPPRLVPPSGCDTLVYAGALVPGKGPDVLLDAFAQAGDALAGFTLVLAGRADDETFRGRLDALAQDPRVAGRVRFAGQVDRRSLRSLIDAARAVVVPSHSEALSRTALEAMLRGTPVVGSAIPGLSEVVQDGRTGWLAPPGDAGALARLLERVCLREDVDARGADARAFAEAQVSTARTVEGHRRVLLAALAGHPADQR